MGYSEFIAKELQGVDEAIRLAKKARKTTLDLQDFFNPPKDSDHESADGRVPAGSYHAPDESL